MIKAEILLDSISRVDCRLTTFALTYPRFIHSEVMTHRVLSRNAASSRAIPIKKMIEDVRKNPAMPVYWGKNQPGMQAAEELNPEEQEKAKAAWLRGCESAIKCVEELMDIGVHKQIANRPLEPWFHMRTLITATEWENFFNLRTHKDAQPEFKALADCMQVELLKSKPTLRAWGEWHLPFVRDDEWGTVGINVLKNISVARCCRVSYLNLDGSNPDITKDMALHDQLLRSGHMSPFEHAAQAVTDKYWYGNFRGWKQYRKFIIGEDVFKGEVRT